MQLRNQGQRLSEITACSPRTYEITVYNTNVDYRPPIGIYGAASVQLLHTQTHTYIQHS
jgi:hypothetical protein